MLKMCSPSVPAFSRRAASSATLKKYLSVGVLAIALISLIKFLVSRAFLFKYPRTLKKREYDKGHSSTSMYLSIHFSTFLITTNILKTFLLPSIQLTGLKVSRKQRDCTKCRLESDGIQDCVPISQQICPNKSYLLLCRTSISQCHCISGSPVSASTHHGIHHQSQLP